MSLGNRALALLLFLSLSLPAFSRPHRRKLLEAQQYDPQNDSFTSDLEDDPFSNLLELTIQKQIGEGSDDKWDNEWFGDNGPNADVTTESYIPERDVFQDLLDIQMTGLHPPGESKAQSLGEDQVELTMADGDADLAVPASTGTLVPTAHPQHGVPSMPSPGSFSSISNQGNLVDATTAASPVSTTPATKPLVSLTLLSKQSSEWNLQGLVENQMASYFPDTGDEKIAGNPGLVQKSFLAALKHDMSSMIDEAWPRDQKPQSDTNELERNAAGMADTGMDGFNETPSQNEFNDEDLKMFFAQYDFEVDADMMQDRILGLLQQATQAAPTDFDNPNDQDVAISRLSNAAVHTEGHFHRAGIQSTPPAPLNHNHTCKHNFQAIFRNLDFEVDAEKMESQIHSLHDDFLSSKPTEDTPPSQPTYLKVSGPAQGRDNLAAFTDHVTRNGAHSQLPDVQALPPAGYFDTQAMDRLNNESVEEFYDRFLAMRGVVIRNVIVS